MKLINWLWSVFIKFNKLYINLCHDIPIYLILACERQFEVEIQQQQQSLDKLKFLQFNLSQFQISKFYDKYFSQLEDHTSRMQLNRSFEYYLCMLFTD